MRQVTWRMRAQDTVAGMKLARAAEARATWTRAQLEEHQRAALRDLVAHATACSPFYRERFAEAGVTADSPVEALPILDKATMVAEWDRIACDARLRQSDARAFADAHHDDDVLFAGEYRVLRTGGSSRIPGLFAYDRADWAQCMSNLFRSFLMAGITPKLPRRRVATLTAPGTLHMATRMSITSDIGVNRTLRLSVTSPIDELAAQLQRHEPDVVGGYPSIIATMAAEQLDGRLRIAPTKIITSSEPCTPVMRERIRAAWGVEPFDMYATTESGGPLAMDCEHHAGLHLFEDACIVEVQDGRVLLTNLLARALPMIRVEVSDLVRLTPDPCACGRPHRLIEPVRGRSDDVLELPAAAGGTVPVHPMTWAPLGSVPGVREFEVILRADGLHVNVVAPGGNGAAALVEQAVHAALDPAGVSRELPTRVRLVPAIPRDAGRAGKAKIVRSEV